MYNCNTLKAKAGYCDVAMFIRTLRVRDAIASFFFFIFFCISINIKHALRARNKGSWILCKNGFRITRL